MDNAFAYGPVEQPMADGQDRCPNPDTQCQPPRTGSGRMLQKVAFLETSLVQLRAQDPEPLRMQLGDSSLGHT